MRRLTGRALVLVAIVFGVTVSPPSAFADWEDPIPLSRSAPNFTGGEGPDVAATSDGSFVAAWFLPDESAEEGFGEIQARRVNPTGEPGPVLTLTPDPGDLHRVRVAAGPAGEAIVYWHRFFDDGQDSVLEARRIAADGSLGPLLNVSDRGNRAGVSSVAIDSAGEATFVWGEHPPDSGFELRVRRLPASGPLGPTMTVPNEDRRFITEVAIAIGPDRRPLVVFGQLKLVKAVRLSQSGEPLPGITQLSQTGDPDDPDVPESLSVGIDRRGLARVVWGRSHPNPEIVSTRTVAPDGTLGPIEIVTEQDSARPQMSVNEAGAAAIVWQFEPDDEFARYSAGVVARPDGSFGASPTLSPPSYPGVLMSPDVAIDGAGIATAVWQRQIGRTERGIVEAVRFTDAGAIGHVTTLDDPEKTLPAPKVAVQPDAGIALSLWVQAPGNAETFRIKAARYVPPPGPTPVPPDPPGPTPPEPTYECHDEQATIVGTSHDNVIEGTPQRDVIDGGPGDDRIKGRGGDDLVCGRDGNDDVRGNKGNDAVYGGDGSDRVAGGAGDDALRGQDGGDEIIGGVNADVIAAGSGDDLARGGAGHDRAHGRAGSDRAFGGRGRDGISGGTGEDDLTGGGANDQIFGGPQDDFLDGDRGVNKCRGGRGTNVLVRCQR